MKHWFAVLVVFALLFVGPMAGFGEEVKYGMTFAVCKKADATTYFTDPELKACDVAGPVVWHPNFQSFVETTEDLVLATEDKSSFRPNSEGKNFHLYLRLWSDGTGTMTPIYSVNFEFVGIPKKLVSTYWDYTGERISTLTIASEYVTFQIPSYVPPGGEHAAHLTMNFRVELMAYSITDEWERILADSILKKTPVRMRGTLIFPSIHDDQLSTLMRYMEMLQIRLASVEAIEAAQ